MTKKALLFDFGGTIDTDGVHWSEKFWEVYQKQNIPISKQDYEKAYVFAENNVAGQVKPGDSFNVTLEKQLRLQIEYLKIFGILKVSNYEEVIIGLKDVCYKDVCNTIGSAKKILQGYKTKYALGVVSNFYGNLETVLKEYKINDLFSAIIDSEKVGCKKPDPEIFIYALTELKTDPLNTIVIGDSYDRDIQPAKKVGCSTVWLDGKSWKRPSDTHDADYTINSLSDLSKII
jgi:FMN phosphatase YigB (HAD superfamily)